MNRYYISVAGWNGAGVTAPCIIIGQEFEAETERTQKKTPKGVFFANRRSFSQPAQG